MPELFENETPQQEETAEAKVIVTVPDSSELDTVIKDSGLAVLDGEAIKGAYLPFLNRLVEVKELSGKVNFDSPTEIDVKIAHDLRVKTMRIRTDSERTKDDRKKIHLLMGNLEQSSYNIIKDSCLLIEHGFEQVEKAREIAEKKRKEVLRNERIELLKEYCETPEIYPLADMQDNSFTQLLNGMKLAKEQQIEADRKAEEARIENMRLDEQKREREIKVAPYEQWITAGQFTKLREMSNEDYDSLMDLLSSEKKKYEEEQAEIRRKNEELLAQQEKERQEQKQRDELQSKRLKELLPVNAFGDTVDMATLWTLDEKKYQKILKEKTALFDKDEAEAIEKECIRQDAEKKEFEASLKKAIERKEKLLGLGFEEQVDNGYFVLRSEKCETGFFIYVETIIHGSDSEFEAAIMVAQTSLEKHIAEIENNKKIEQAKKLAAAGDKEQLAAWLDGIKNTVDIPGKISPEATEVADNIITKFAAFKTWALSEISKL